MSYFNSNEFKEEFNVTLNYCTRISDSSHKNVISDIIKNKYLLDEEISDNINDNIILNKICMKNIERNFGGLVNSIKEFKSYFNELLNADKKNDNIKEYELLKCLKDSLFDNDCRYLLMISDSSMSRDILNYMLDEINN